MITQPTTTAAPIRILLGPEESEILSDTGHSAFIVIGRASYPRDPKRWIINIVPIEINDANGIHGIIHGTHKATRIKQSSK